MTQYCEMFRRAARIHLDFALYRYLMSNAHGRWDGAEKAVRHGEICKFYVSAILGDNSTHNAEDLADAYKRVHSATQVVTDHLDESIGFPLDSEPDYDALVPVFFEKIHNIALQCLATCPSQAKFAHAKSTPKHENKP